MFADFNAIVVGDVRTLTKRITEDDVKRFVELTGDNNPLHVDPAFAETTPFKDVVVHGMLGASFISTVIGTKLPGPGALWVSQAMEFNRPVRLGDELTVACTVLKKHERDRLLELETTITNQTGDIILSGRAKVKVLAAKVAVAVAAAKPVSKVAIVTGAAGGIGSAICRRLSADGFAVVANYSRSRDRAERLVAELNEAGGRAVAVVGNLGQPGAAQSILGSTLAEFGGVGVLINNASPPIGAKSIAQSNWEEMQRHIDVQVRGAFDMAKACYGPMSTAAYGRIVNITSQVVEAHPTSNWSAYAVAKTALAALSRYMAAEWGPSGITVNCVAPGMTETSLIGDVPEKAQMMAARQTPLRRLATPADVAAAVAYLVSDGAAHVTGHTLAVNGGSAMR